MLNVARLYPVFVSETVAVGQAGFEPSQGGVIVRYGDNTDDRMFPLMVLARGDSIVVGQGNTVVVPLEGASGLSIRSADGHRAPWVLIGLEQSDAPGAPADDVRAGHRLGAPQMVTGANGRLQIVPWDAAPWRQDVRRLAQLADMCSASGSLDVRQVGDRVHLTLGTCEGDVDPPPSGNPSSAQWRIAVAGETRGAFVRRRDGTWHRHRQIVVPFLVVILLLYVAQATAFGITGAALVGAPCLIGGFWEPVAAAYLWIALGAIASLVVIAFGVRAGVRRWPVLTFIVGAAVVTTTWLALYSTVRDRSRPEASPIGGASECLLTGYSTAGDTTLPDRKFGVRAQLDDACPRCRHRTGRWAEAGQAFGWFALRLCSPDFPTDTRVVAHLGGANDDFLIAHGPVETLLFGFLVCVRVGMAPPDPLRMVDTLAAASSRQLATKETHARDISTVMGCARARGVRFFYFHDFLAMDLDGHRTAVRQELLDERKKATEANGGTFVDLLATFSDRAGVHWFNDFIHLSAVGHQQVAALMCATMSAIDVAPTPREEALRGG